MYFYCIYAIFDYNIVFEYTSIPCYTTNTNIDPYFRASSIQPRKRLTNYICVDGDQLAPF